LCNTTGAIFCARVMIPMDVRGKKVLDVGSRDVDGSIRLVIEALKPAEYVGTDIAGGNGVDVICDAEDILDKFGPESFDIVISTEVIEHVRNWKKVVSNLKQATRRGGLLLITTRSIGFPFHGFPNDYWRYQVEDMEKIFSDFNILEIESDSLGPGVFMLAEKPEDFQEKDLSDYRLHALAHGEKVLELNESRVRKFLKIKLFMERIKHLGVKVARKMC